MRLIANILANILSLVFYPLFIPTYGIALCCYAMHTPWLWTLIAMAGTVLLTCVLPLVSIGLMIKRGQVEDIQIAKASERTMPYIYTIIGFAFWCQVIGSVLHAPLFLTLVCIGATVALIVVTIVNRYWKISAHLTGIGGLIGGLISYYIALDIAPTGWTIAAWMLFSLVMMYARLRLNAHTSAQVVAGWLLGLCCTALPNCILSYAA